MAIRKLQTEIDKVLKKVSEGVEVFEGIFEKIQQAGNITQKEKMESELKKEIKKLQRYRDQIKVWISSNDIKDKRALLDNRKLIELACQQMERFKACEKELKTKAYSKEGLSLAAKVDPLEREKTDLANWLTEMIDKLNSQIDAFEAEAETLQVQKKRGKDTSRQERLSQIEDSVARHKHHITKLEIVMRMLENGNISVENVKDIKDNVMYYVDNNQEPDFEEDEGLYDELNLDDAEVFGFNNEDESEESEEEEPEPKPVVEEQKKEKEIPAFSPSKVTKTLSSKPSVKEESTPTKSLPSGSKAAKTPLPVTKTLSTPTKAPEPVAVAQAPGRYAAAAAAGASMSDSSARGPTPVPSSGTPIPPEEKKVSSKKLVSEPQSFVTGMQSSAIPLSISDTPIPLSTSKPPQIIPPPLSKTSSLEQVKDEPINTPAPINNHLPPSVADLVSSFEITKDRAGKAKEDPKFLQEMLNTSFQHLPESADAERPKYYFPQSSYPNPGYFPDTPLAVFENPAIYEMFDLDTLFFIFYYQQGTYQQYVFAFAFELLSKRPKHRYLAAKELKKHAWRFHKKYQTWFQRHDEPKAINDEYEQGTYIYFDFENEWCQRKKNDFRSASAESDSVDPKIADIVNKIAGLSLLETASLVQALKTKLNITEVAVQTVAAPAAAAAAAPVEAAAPAEEKPPEKLAFKVKLEKVDAASKAKVIREIKNLIPGSNLVEAKKFVEGVPKVIKENVPKEDAEKMKTLLEGLGATVVLE
ncbi:general negative regulator of transcription subunit 5 [Phlyctochytrium planicorne]|nr:general negative regulator of transcription subunit 5 [Phlyctochytrium planicorne]